MQHKISVVIPTYNEGAHIARLIEDIHHKSAGLTYEIIVADGGSTDTTVEAVSQCDAILVHAHTKGRGAQLNAGAKAAHGNLLFFMHADSQPPENFLQDVVKAVEAGYTAGCFRLKFDSNNWFIRANAWFTRFNIDAVRFGDQGLFVTRKMFDKAGGYRDDHLLMEDQEIVLRLKKHKARFKVLKKSMITSARKYEENGALNLQYHFFIIWWNYYRGKSQDELVRIYNKRILDQKMDEPNDAIKELQPNLQPEPSAPRQ